MGHPAHNPALWAKVRAHYEATDATCLALAKTYGLGRSTITKKAKAENWQRNNALAKTTIRELENQTTLAVREVAAEHAIALRKQISDGLAAWCERERKRHVKAQVIRSKRALTRLDTLGELNAHGEPNLEPKDEHFLAKSVETYDTIIRRNLGMENAGQAQSSLNLNILTNHSAVQITPKQD